MAARVNPGDRRPIIGMATRFASEKGVEMLLDALPRIVGTPSRAVVLFAGQHLDVSASSATTTG